MRSRWASLALLCGLGLGPAVVGGQDREPLPSREASTGREHFQLKLGAGYDQGDFGTSSTTRSVYAPITFRYLGDRFDLGVTASLVYLDTESSVVVVDGLPTAAERQRRTTEVGFGDIILRGRYYLLEDPGVGSYLPALAPFLKVKAPTASASKGLGTGEWDVGFGLEFDKRFTEFFILGDLGYTFIGDPPGQHFRNRPAASLGIGHFFMPTLAVTVLLDWRRSLVRGRDDPLELFGIVQVKVAPTVTLTPYAFAGLTDGSPDFGVGLELSWRFGRY
jgi:Putative MetA-pathway of phenol degradation